MSENKFKVGDKVRCIEDYVYGLNKGDVYTVLRLKEGGRPGIHLSEVSPDGFYYESRFEPVKAPEFRIRNAPGGVSFATFPSAEDAQEAARREFLDGDEFEVVEVRTVAKYKVAKTLQPV